MESPVSTKKSAAGTFQANPQTQCWAARVASGQLRPDTAKRNPPRTAHIQAVHSCLSDRNPELSLPPIRQKARRPRTAHSRASNPEQTRSACARRFAPDATALEASPSTVATQPAPKEPGFEPTDEPLDRSTHVLLLSVAATMQVHRDARNLLAPRRSNTPSPERDSPPSSFSAKLLALARRNWRWERFLQLAPAASDHAQQSASRSIHRTQESAFAAMQRLHRYSCCG